MKKKIAPTIKRRETKPCRLIFNKSSRTHQFGGEGRHVGTKPKKCNVHLHHLMTLDLSDPNVPIEVTEGSLSVLPLYYPLRFGWGGGEAQYSVLNDSEIHIHYVVNGHEDETVYPFMEQFPERPIRLQPFKYDEFRALLMMEHGEGFELSEEDHAILSPLKIAFLSQIGGSISPTGGGIQWTCYNPRCEWHSRPARIDPFARISGTPTKGIGIFDDSSWSGVEIYYGLCRMCSSIITLNRCT